MFSSHVRDALGGFDVPGRKCALNRFGRGEALGTELGVRQRVRELLSTDAQVRGQPGVDRVALLALRDPAGDPGRDHDHDRREQKRPKSQRELPARRSRWKSRQRCRRASLLTGYGF